MYLFMHKSILLTWIDPTGLIVMYAPYSDAVIASQVHCIAWILSHCIQHLLEFSRYKKSEQPLSMCFDITCHAVISVMHAFSCTCMTQRMLMFGYICLIFFFDCLLVALHFFVILHSKLQVSVLNRDGWERQILLRSVLFVISSEALIGCGHSLCLGSRFTLYL